MYSLEIKKKPNILHYLIKGIISLSATQSKITLATRTGCVSPWKWICVNERMWAFLQIDLWAHALKSVSLPPIPLPSHADTVYDDKMVNMLRNTVTLFMVWTKFLNDQRFQNDKKTHLFHPALWHVYNVVQLIITWQCSDGLGWNECWHFCNELLWLRNREGKNNCMMKH